MTKAFGLAAALLCVCAVTASAQEPKLRVGSPAPAIEVAEFVKGEPVESFDKGKVYVVEFLGHLVPAVPDLDPHLTALQKKHKNVTFIGVSVWERNNDFSKVKPFVEQMGDKMEYRVAIDKVEAGQKTGRMAETWMTAAGQRGIPAAFIVKNGVVVWIGHPMQMDKPLADIVAGKTPTSGKK